MGPTGAFPARRLRRTRSAPWLRDLVRETTLSPKDLIWPVFVIEGDDTAEPISSMPGVFRLTMDRLAQAAKDAQTRGIPALALFPVTPPGLKTPEGVEALNPGNLMCRAIRTVREVTPDLGTICDVALDPYTSHGHDGLMDETGRILNDPSVEVLCAQAVNQAKAGCAVIAPSDMMDGRVSAIRAALDGEGFEDVSILSYAAKYASCFYGPFREAVGSGGVLTGDKRTYQMDPANTDEALHEATLDVAEGADMLMVKPGLPYLDIIQRLKNNFQMPVFAYHVSGEYAMLMAAAERGWLDRDKAVLESLLSLRRAGADGILTYAAPLAADLLNG